MNKRMHTAMGFLFLALTLLAFIPLTTDEIVEVTDLSSDCLVESGDNEFSVSTKKVTKVKFPKVDSMDAATRQFYKRFAHVVVDEQRKYGIPASIIMARAILESGIGKSDLSFKHNNYFGHKCFSKKCGKGHCINYNDDHHKDFFIRYPSAWASFRAHSKWLSNTRYKPLHKHGLDYKKWAKGLKAKGYATEPSYSTYLINLIERYELHHLDYIADQTNYSLK